MSEHIVLEDPGQNGERHEAGGDSVTRRLFLGLSAAAGVAYAAAIAYPIYRYLNSPAEMAASLGAVKEVLLKDAQKLAKGSALMFKFGSRPGVLIHHQDDSWTALSAVCTHLGCTVQYEPELNRIHCNCHGGVYDPVTGKNVSGPPPKPLTRYSTVVNDNGVLVSRA